MELLSGYGTGVDRPYLFHFYFYLPTSGDAEGLAAELRAQGYQVDVRPAAKCNSMLCLATTLMVPREAEMNALGDRIEELAEKYNGEFDGWETGVD